MFATAQALALFARAFLEPLGGRAPRSAVRTSRRANPFDARRAPCEHGPEGRLLIAPHRLLATLCATVALAPAPAGAQCEGGVASACRDEAAAASAAGAHGRALELLDAGCRAADAGACAALVELLTAHPEARASAPRLSSLLVSRCAQGDDAMCAQLGRDVFDDRDRLRRSAPARAALAAACERDVGAACAGRGVIAEALRARRAEGEARADFERACRLGEGRACRRLGELAEASDPQEATARFAEACGLGETTAR